MLAVVRQRAVRRSGAGLHPTAERSCWGRFQRVTVDRIAMVSSHAETTDALRADPPEFGSKPFTRKIGLAGANQRKVAWTAELIHRGLTFYATCAREDPEPAFQKR